MYISLKITKLFLVIFKLINIYIYINKMLKTTEQSKDQWNYKACLCH
jgi:hypothetical protein